jgi:hypothetical protein
VCVSMRSQPTRNRNEELRVSVFRTRNRERKWSRRRRRRRRALPEDTKLMIRLDAANQFWQNKAMNDRRRQRKIRRERRSRRRRGLWSRMASVAAIKTANQSTSNCHVTHAFHLTLTRPSKCGLRPISYEPRCRTSANRVSSERIRGRKCCRPESECPTYDATRSRSS